MTRYIIGDSVTPDVTETPGYRAHCERRWIETQQAIYVDALMELHLARWLAVKRPEGIRRKTDRAIRLAAPRRDHRRV